MRVLLDSHSLLWAGTAPHKLGPAALNAIVDPNVDVYWSVVTFWELTIKEMNGKLPLSRGLELLAADVDAELIEIGAAHVRCLRALPLLHRDPFDRMLVAQAVIENMALVTCDRDIVRCPVPTVW